MRIAVVGLRYGQRHHVERACEGIADLTFVDADRAEATFPDCEAVILLTSFLRHRWTEAAYRVFPRERVHLHPGGIKKLVRRIRRVAAGFIAVEKRPG
jgi:hypothetical protein